MSKVKEMGTLKVDGRAVKYFVRRRPRGKSIYLRMKPNLELDISIPLRFKVDIRAILRKKREWIKKKWQEMSNNVKMFDGDLVLYKGVYHKLVTEKSTWRKVRVRNREIILPVSDGMELKQALKQWMKSETKMLVRRRLARYSDRYGLSANGFSIGDMKKWAHCTRDGDLLFNWQLIGLPKELADYVILHELTHLKEFNHSRRFKYELASVCPDFKEREAALKRFVAAP